MSSIEVNPDELQRAARTLIARPLLRSGGPDANVAAVVRRPEYRQRLQRWFDHQLGWKLVVDRDVVRLHKVPASGCLHPEDAPSQRTCVLYCLLLVALEEIGEQVVISELADRVAVLARTRPEISPYDPARYRDRKELVSAIRQLVEHGALAPTRDDDVTKQDEQSFVAGTGNALYDVDHRAAALLLACPVPPSRAGTPAGLTRESVPDTQDGRNRHRRHVLMRKLVDEPALYFDDLAEDQLGYLHSQRHTLIRELHDVLGVRVEVRAEGIAIVDDELTDMVFPRERAAQFAALLLAGHLADEPGVRTRTTEFVSDERLAELAATITGNVERRRVRTIDQHPVTPDSVRAVAQKMLTALRLIEPVPGGIRVLPALGRYRGAADRPEWHAETSALFGTSPRGTVPHPEDPHDL